MLEQVVLSAQVKGPGVDKAFEYLKKHEKDAPESSASLKSIRRKVDHRLVPLLFFTYFFQFLDKVAYNVRPLKPATKPYLNMCSMLRSWACARI